TDGVETPDAVVPARAESTRLSRRQLIAQLLVNETVAWQRRLRRRATRIAGDDLAAAVEQRERRAVFRARAALIALREPIQTDEQGDRPVDQAWIGDERPRGHDAPAAEPAADDQIAPHEAVARHDVAEPDAIVDLDDLRHRSGCASHDAFGVHDQRAF